jgi:PilZ domain-containing protein
MPKRGGIRRHERISENAPIRLMWKDRFGGDKFANGRVLDVSEEGMRIELPIQIEERIYVTFRADTIPLNGTASVRSCVRQTPKFVVGLEFAGGLKWKPPKAESGSEPKGQ